jgi:uncharacterized protein
VPRVSPEDLPTGPLVKGFTAAGFVVEGRAYPALFLTPEEASEWAPPPLGELTIADVEPVLGLARPPEFLLLGTGPRLLFPPRAFIRAVEERGMGIEVMDSRAGARTWGLLRSEERWIAAALMPLA